ncbi:MAG: RNA methyltransferase [Rhodospirillales bacterium]|nr:RNA methyltransferase [Rhodospirillales bacterium]
MRGYFGIGAEGISKAMNVGSIFRTAHAFGAGFVFTVGAQYAQREGGRADTSAAPGHVPFYSFPDAGALMLPDGCSLIGIELTEDAVELPSFHHPQRAAYVLGPERGSVSPGLQKRCDFVVKIPMRFCVNVGIAAAIVMYDRTLSLGRFARRPGMPGGAVEPMAEHVHGAPRIRAKMDKFLAPPPDEDGTP